jgi:uncharacterized protein (DUF1800 family)
MRFFFRYPAILSIVIGLQACGGGGGSGGGSIPTPITQGDAARFLAQATFGPTLAEMTDLLSLDDPALDDEPFLQWIAEQLSLPFEEDDKHLPYVIRRDDEKREFDAMDVVEPKRETGNDLFRHQAWWNSVITGEHQLRHRMAYALSQILVISDLDPNLTNAQFGMASYYDLLAEHAFENYRDLLIAVSKHPTMGTFLSSVNNVAATGNIRPDENYARELMQLFSIGVFELNIDGTLKLDPVTGEPIPTYDEDDIKEMAKVFTGWKINYDLATAFNYMTVEMIVPDPGKHDLTAKDILGGVPLPAGQTAQLDLEGAIDKLMDHPNMAPFISKQLIQRLVTSNPTPAYVARVAAVFNNNGNNVKGDLAAVVTAILLDNEARNGHLNTSITGYGKLREPLLRISHLWRTFKAIPIMTGEYGKAINTPYYRMPYTSHRGFIGLYGQALLKSPSVFNFYRPDYSPPNLNDLDMVAPEFQITTETTIVELLNSLNRQIQNAFNTTYTYTRPDLTDELALIPATPGLTEAQVTGPLLDHLNLLLLSDAMSTGLRTILSNHLFTNFSYSLNEEERMKMVMDALTLIISSPEYLVQK